MKKTYVTSMPNHIGAFLKASRCFSALNINITRVSYNKAVDSHTLFIDAEGTAQQLEKADAELEKIGYLQDNKSKVSIVLIEFCLKDVPGSVTDILTLINDFNFNISYMSSQENGSDFQLFKMGLYVDDAQKISDFLKEAKKLCTVRVIDYSGSEKYMITAFFTIHTLTVFHSLWGCPKKLKISFWCMSILLCKLLTNKVCRLTAPLTV